MPKGMGYKSGMRPKTGKAMGKGMTPGSKPMKTVRSARVRGTNSGLTFKPNGA